MNSELTKIYIANRKRGKQPKNTALIPTTNKFWATVSNPRTPLLPNPQQPRPKGLLPHPRTNPSGYKPRPQTLKTLTKAKKKSMKGNVKTQNYIKASESDIATANKDVHDHTSIQQFDDKQIISGEQTGNEIQNETRQDSIADSSQGNQELSTSIPEKQEINDTNNTSQPNSISSSSVQQEIDVAKPLYTVSRNNIVYTVSQPHSQYAAKKQFHNNISIPLFTFPKGIPKSFFIKSLNTEAQNTQHFQQPQTNQPVGIWPTQQPTTPMYNDPGNQTQIFVQLPDQSSGIPQAYSPSDAYTGDVYTNNEEEIETSQDNQNELDSSDVVTEGQKRLSAFQRLGPLTQPKKPKLTINLLFNKQESVREVLDLTDDKQPEEYVPVHLRQNVITSTDEIVMKYLILWPWKKGVLKRKIITARHSKSVMILEQEQMEEYYEKDNQFFQVSITGYPPTWTKEMVLDALLEKLDGKSFIPCFIEFTREECMFLVIRCRPALVAIHKFCFALYKNDVEMQITISLCNLTLNNLYFIPRLVLRKKLAMSYDGEDSLNLKEFTLKEDLSHFIYFPLSRPTNQSELMQLQSSIACQNITALNLSYNKITSIDSFNLSSVTPKLQNLDLSYNLLEKLTVLISIRELPLHSIKMEGNPLCLDYRDPEHYVKVIKMLFPTIKEIDGIKLQLKGELPAHKKSYCPEDATPLVNKFLDIYFPLLDANDEDRLSIRDLYEKNALITITYKYNFIYRYFRKIPHRSRIHLDDGEKEIISGAAAMVKTISSWPNMKHDPFSMSIDVLYHNDTRTILRMNGILKLTTESLADEEHVIAFAKTIALRTNDGVEYKISNELVLFDEPNIEHANNAFQMTRVTSKELSLKFEETPNDDLKEKLVEIFIKLTDLDSRASKRCLELKDWNLKNALEYFTQLLKLNDLSSLNN